MMTGSLKEIALGPHHLARPENGVEDGEQKGDLDTVQGELEALQARLTTVAARLAYLYGEGAVKGLQSATPAGKIPRLMASISDLSDTVGEIEQVIEKL